MREVLVLCVLGLGIAAGMLVLVMRGDTTADTTTDTTTDTTADTTAARTDRLKGLPTAPPPVSPRLQPTVNYLFGMESNCWQANHWARVTMPRVLQEIDVEARTKTLADVNAVYKQRVSDSHWELLSCGEEAWFVAPGRGRMTMRQAMGL